MRLAIRTAARAEKAESTPVQKKMTPAVATERWKRSKSQSASNDCTTKPPPNESRLNRAASLRTMPREVVKGAGGAPGLRLNRGRQVTVEEQRHESESGVEQKHAVEGLGQAEPRLVDHELREASCERAARGDQ